MACIKEKITADRLRAVLRYEPETGFFYWRNPKRGLRIENPAGYLNLAGYVVINPDRLGPLLAHRLAWLYTHGTHAGQMIDHINGVRSDNRILNLRLADNFVNQQNRNRANQNNRTGLLGVVPHQGGFRSRVMVNRVTHEVGVFGSAADAHAAYVEKKRQLMEAV